MTRIIAIKWYSQRRSLLVEEFEDESFQFLSEVCPRGYPPIFRCSVIKAISNGSGNIAFIFWLEEPGRVIREQFLHASHVGGNERDAAGHNFPSLLGKAIGSEGVLPIADDTDIECAEESRYFFVALRPHVVDSRVGRDRDVPRADKRDVQGLKDAVLDGRTGFLVEAGNTEGFLGRIREMDLNRDAVRSLVVETFDWQRVFERYEEVLGPFPSR